ncbi:MAG: lactate racemase domain-containing protein [Fibrobacterota bacterium]
MHNKKLTETEVRAIFKQAAAAGTFKGQKVLAVFPDHTRSGPVPIFFRAFCDYVGASAARLDFLIALGTHMPMTDAMIEEHFGISTEERKGKYGKFGVFNHAFDDPKENIKVGTLTQDETRRISNGLLDEDVPVEINRRVLDYDLLVICGPVFPHEVVGFSGGNKYLFPGIAAAEIINFFHWLGALVTNPKIIGNKMTVVRKVVEICAAMVKKPKFAFCYVVDHGDIAGLYAGEAQEAWGAAADLSNALHITYMDRAFHTVLSCAPKMYDDIWTAGKCMYKLEPVVSDGGTLIIYAPHVTEVSYTHGKVLDKIGYHTRDYFAKQMDKFQGVPRGVIAHATHVRGIGTFEGGVEKPRVKVVLATGIPKERCERINLGYMDPKSINISEYQNREAEGILYIPKAGEMLYKLKSMPKWQCA